MKLKSIMESVTPQKYTVKYFKDLIESETGIKVSVRLIKTGSMKYYVKYSPIKIKNEYPSFNFDWSQKFNARFPPKGQWRTFATIDTVFIPAPLYIDDYQNIFV